MRYSILIGLVLFIKITSAQNILDWIPDHQVIEKPDSMSSYQALVQSKKLPFLRHADPNFDRKNPGFWKKVDTVIINQKKIRVIRAGNCKDADVVPVKVENCTEHQYRTINVLTNRVLRFTAEGTDHSVLIEFVYNKKNLLVRYTENGAPSKLKYDASGKLLTVHSYKVVSGNLKLKRTINFKARGAVGNK